jgi:hypothetical protein
LRQARHPMPSPKPLALIATLRLNTPDRPKMSARQQNPQQNQHLRQCKGDKQRPERTKRKREAKHNVSL